MAVFKYQAKAMSGKMVRGELEATDPNDARLRIRAKHMLPVLVEIKGGNGVTRATTKAGAAVSSKDLQVFTRQFSTLIASGVPVDKSLLILSNGSRSPALKATAARVRADVEGGLRLWESMKPYPRVFDKLYVNLVKSAEDSGNLDVILNRLAIYIEKSNKIISKVKGAMFYPTAVLAVAGLVVAGILTFVIPKFEELFKSSGQHLPWLTQQVVNMSHEFKNHWYLYIGALVGAIYGLKEYYRSDSGKAAIDSIMIRTPLLGAVIQKAAIARFCRTLSTMLSSGMKMLESLDVSAQVLGNAQMEQTVIKAKTMVSEGKPLAVAFMGDKYFPDLVVQMMGVGEQTGKTDEMLGKIADFYEEEVDYAVTAMTSMIEPLMMVVLGAIIAVLVVAMYLPIFNLAGGVS
jgi:type IV pilus assembly protein PilC